MGEKESKNKFDELFPNDAEKARAFEKIAEKYYYCNFGSTQKSDFDILMFSIYLEQILNNSEAQIQTYSDYQLSKYLGITQERVQTLKVKKELRYPYPKFDWRESFKRICHNARFKQGKIVLHIPDKNLFLEIKNAIEGNNGYIELQLNSTLLVVSPEFFVDLILCISKDEDRSKIETDLRKELKKKNLNADFMNKQTFGEIVRENSKELGIDIVCSIISSCIPGIGEPIANIIKKHIPNNKESE